MIEEGRKFVADRKVVGAPTLPPDHNAGRVLLVGDDARPNGQVQVRGRDVALHHMLPHNVEVLENARLFDILQCIQLSMMTLPVLGIEPYLLE